MARRLEQRRKAFSLMELVIVVAIIGIIAAIAVPRMYRGSSNAGEKATEASLYSLQGAIERYTAEHAGAPPDLARIAEQLTQFTDAFGNVSATRTTKHIFGPYLREIPPIQTGPAKGSRRIAAAPGKGVGWIYDEASSQISPNDGALAPAEVAAGS